MDAGLNSIYQSFPGWFFFGAAALASLIFGWLTARQLWGRNGRRLRAALEDHAYLADQWASLALSQSQLVEKLGQKVSAAFETLRIRQAEAKAEIRHREETIKTLQQQILRLEKSRDEPSPREMEALQIQAFEIERRDHRLQILESRLRYLDEQSDSAAREHQAQVRQLLDRIAALEKNRTSPDEVLVRDNEQLTSLLKSRCAELESLKIECDAKEQTIALLREEKGSRGKEAGEKTTGEPGTKARGGEQNDVKTTLEEITVQLRELRLENARHVEEISRLNRLIALGNGSQAVVFDPSIPVAPVPSGEARHRPAEIIENATPSRVISESKSAPARPISPRLRRGKKSLIHFEEQSASIKSEDFLVIEEIAREVLETHCRLSISGFAGSEGDDAFRKSISLARAEAVKMRLIDHGVDPSFIIVRGLGEDSRSGRGGESWKARRVEMVALPVAEIVN